MSYYLVLLDDEPVPGKCPECYVVKLFADSEIGAQVHQLYLDKYYGDYMANIPCELRESIDDRLQSFEVRYPSVKFNELFESLFKSHYESSNYTICELSDIDTFLSYACNGNMQKDQEITLAEIDAANVFHHHNCRYYHILNDYHIVRKWSINGEFIEHLIQQGMNLSQNGHRFMNFAINTDNLELIDDLIKLGVDLNCKDSFRNRYGLLDVIDYAWEASNRRVVTLALKHILKRGCRNFSYALIQNINNPEIVAIILPYCKVEELDFSERCRILNAQ